MGSRRQNTSERRLAHVRAIKDQFYTDGISVEEQLVAKELRIAELEHEIADLRERLRDRRSEPELVAPDRRSFDFYRD